MFFFARARDKKEFFLSKKLTSTGVAALNAHLCGTRLDFGKSIIEGDATRSGRLNLAQIERSRGRRLREGESGGRRVHWLLLLDRRGTKGESWVSLRGLWWAGTAG